jgi:hypothetical protein
MVGSIELEMVTPSTMVSRDDRLFVWFGETVLSHSKSQLGRSFLHATALCTLR